MSRFLSFCLSATIQKTVTFGNLELTKVNRSESYRMDASGKAVNSARVLNQLEPGCVTAVCPLGAKNSALFLELAARDSLHVLNVEIPGYTRECLTLLDRLRGTTTEIVITEPAEAGDCSEQEAGLVGFIDGILPFVDGVLIAGSRPEVWSDGLVACAAKMAVSAGKILLADYCGEDLKRTLAVCTPSVIKINEEEFSRTFGFDTYLPEDVLIKAVAGKSREFDNMIVVTRGKNDTFAASRGEFFRFPAETVRAVNTTACGDSFSAGFLHEYVLSGNFENALSKGTYCAARNAERECPGSIL